MTSSLWSIIKNILLSGFYFSTLFIYLCILNWIFLLYNKKIVVYGIVESLPDVKEIIVPILN